MIGLPSKLLCVTTAVAAISTPNVGLAWGDQGHEVVAAIAWAEMKPKTKSLVSELLAADPDALTQPDFVSRSTWADKFRDSDRPRGRFRSSPDRSPRYLGTRNWHFIDIPLSTDPKSTIAIMKIEERLCPHPILGQPASLGAPADDCVVDKIQQFRAELGNRNTPRAERILALKFLIHLVGDLHQPLHAADDNDKGGNCVFVAGGPRGGKTKLHGYWDTVVIKALLKRQAPADFGTALAHQITPLELKTWQNGTPSVWAAESFRIARQVSYALNSPKLPTCQTENDDEPLQLPAGYRSKAEVAAEEQLQKAGVRLAWILDQAFVHAG